MPGLLPLPDDVETLVLGDGPCSSCDVGASADRRLSARKLLGRSKRGWFPVSAEPSSTSAADERTPLDDTYSDDYGVR